MIKQDKKVLVIIGNEDKPYLARLTSALQGFPAKVYAGKIVTISHVNQLAKKAGASYIITTRVDVLRKLLPLEAQKSAKISNYSGSYIKHSGLQYLIIPPLQRQVTVPYGDFLLKRYITKITRPAKWRIASKFDWELVEKSDQRDKAKEFLSTCDIIGMDIETRRKNLVIVCIAFSGIRIKDSASMTYVIEIDSTQKLSWVRELSDIQVPKIFQNGKYDLAYLSRYNALPWGYYFDTVNMMHAWYAELPKDLGALTALLVRDSMYWKDLSKTNDKMEYFRYNALDAWGTAEAGISWLLEAPDWALNNYKMKFPQVFPAHMCEMMGIKRDMDLTKTASDNYEAQQELILSELKAGVGHPDFNPSSPKQVLRLIRLLSYNTAKDSSEATLQEACTKHPLLDWFCTRIIEYRKLRKLSSTYFKQGEDAAEFEGRVLFSLNPHGTETGRYASKSHHFWCGLQIQNQPESAKRTLVADPGYDLWEADYAQAEDRGVAYKSGDANLLDIFYSGKDSHAVKASMFFGIPYDEIYSDELGKVLDKVIRQLGKKINHGANYNMQEYTLFTNMGSAKVRQAQRVLNLPKNLDLIGVCKELLSIYATAFPKVKTHYYTMIKKEVRETHKLTGDLGWVRYCFGDPSKSRNALNEYIAHVTQSLNAMILDKAMIKVFKSLAFNPDFKLVAQVHDSLLFQVKHGHDELADQVKKLMTSTYRITDSYGEVRNLTVPVDLTKLGYSWKGDE